MPGAGNIFCFLATVEIQVNIASGCVECIHQLLKREELGELSLSISILFVSFFGLLTIKILVRSRSIRLVGGSVAFSTVLICRLAQTDYFFPKAH